MSLQSKKKFADTERILIKRSARCIKHFKYTFCSISVVQ